MDAKMNCDALMKRIREVDFAIVETALFLDAYPDNTEALSYYHELKKMLTELRHAYLHRCGPLTIYNNECETSWDWVKKPWPWELCAD